MSFVYWSTLWWESLTAVNKNERFYSTRSETFHHEKQINRRRWVGGSKSKTGYKKEIISSEKWHFQKVISVWLSIWKMEELLFLTLHLTKKFNIIIFANLFFDSRWRLETSTRTDCFQLYREFKSPPLAMFRAFWFWDWSQREAVKGARRPGSPKAMLVCQYREPWDIRWKF